MRQSFHIFLSVTYPDINNIPGSDIQVLKYLDYKLLDCKDIERKNMIKGSYHWEKLFIRFSLVYPRVSFDLTNVSDSSPFSVLSYFLLFRIGFLALNWKFYHLVESSY